VSRTFSATEARIRFGELIQDAQKGPVFVERGGKPIVVVLSKQEYDRLLSGARPADWRELVDKAHQRVRIDLAGHELPDPAFVLDEIREERDGKYDLH
jgi:prevent-host-death family protein